MANEIKIEDILKETKDVFASMNEKTNKMEAKITALHTRQDEFETKYNRPPIPGPVAPGVSPEVKAFNKWLRKDTMGLSPEEHKLLATDESTTGGYLVPTVMRNTIIELIVKNSPIRRYASVATISGNSLEIPYEASGTFAASWIAERGTRAETAVTSFGMRRIPVHEMYADPRATQTMIDDASFDVENWITRKVAERYATTEGTAFISGTGVGQPEGINTNTEITNYDCATTVSCSVDDLFDAYYKHESTYLAGAVWLMHRNMIGYLRKLKAVANGNYLLPPTVGGISAMGEVPMQSLLGIPIVECPDMYSLNAGAIETGNKVLAYLANLREGYQIVDKSTVSMMRDPYTNKPYVEFYATKRVGGQVIQPLAFTRVRSHVD
jgi:HK97 family phage major capsid protein